MPNGFQHYIPILKGRLGEFTALSSLHPLAESFTPLLEIAPTGVEFNDEGDPDPITVTAEIDRFIERVGSKWADEEIIVDAALLPGNEFAPPPILEVIGLFGDRLPHIRPVVRPSDDRALIRDVGDELRRVGGGRACIRLAGEDLDDTEEPLVSSSAGRVTASRQF